MSFALLVNKVYAAILPSCSVQLAPTPLLSSNRKATFTINVNNNQNYDAYRMEFKCGAPNLKLDATKIGSSDIFVELDKSYQPSGTIATPCEFDTGSHGILVKALINNQEIDQCTATYNVIPSQTQCSLTIDPTQEITSATSLKASGKYLTPQGRFVVFFDDDAIDIPNNPAGRPLMDTPFADVSTPEFSPKSIPQELMTPGSHTISLRQPSRTSDWANPFSLLKQEKDFYGPPLCPIGFTVGSPDKPGSVMKVPAATSCTDPKKCTKGGGDTCDKAGGRGPAIKTAIGCIHTSPAEFVKDFLKFIIGIGGGLAFLMMLLGAFQMLTSAGNPETLAAGRDRLQSAIIGLLFIIFAVLLLQIIGFDILKIPGFGR